MKTRILHLDPHDDVISARDKIGSGQTGRILLVWPDRGRVLTRRLDLTLILRHTNALGSQLALVTHDSDVRYHARNLGIPVFKGLRKAQSAHWRPDRRFRVRQQPSLARPEGPPPDLYALRQQVHPPTPAWLVHPGSRLFFFTLGVLALLSIAALLVPGAKITLTPETQIQEISLEVQADPALRAISLSGSVPARAMRITVEGREQQYVSGSVEIPAQAATGEVIFTNLSDQAVRIPAGSVVRTLSRTDDDNNPGDEATEIVRFATTQSGVVPAGPGQTLTLPVRALTLGQKGNLPSESLQAIEGPLGTLLTANNPEPTQGGKDRKVPAATEKDRQRLYESLLASLQKTALAELKDNLSPGDLLVSTSPSLTHVLEEAYDPAGSEPSDQLNLNLRLEFEALVVSGADLRDLAEAVLDANLPVGFAPLPDSLKLETLLHSPTDPDDLTSWEMRTERKIQADLPENRAIQLSLGQPPQQATQRLADALPLAEPPLVEIDPTWWPRLPVVPFRIAIFTYESPGR